MPIITAMNKEWSAAAEALQRVAERQPKNGSFCVRIRRMMRVVLPAAEEIEEERQKIIDKYTMRRDGDVVLAGPNQVALTDPSACSRDIKELMRGTAELLVEPLTMKELDAEKIVLTGQIAYDLGPLLVEPKKTEDGVEESAQLPEPTPP